MERSVVVADAWSRMCDSRISRRSLLRGWIGFSVGAVATSLLNACRQAEPGVPATAPPTTPTQTTSPQVTPPITPTATSAITTPAILARGGHLIAANEADPGNLDPAKMVGLPPRRIGRAIYNALVSIDEQGNVHPELVESWGQSDERTYILHLRRGVKFHDGTPFDAEAVKFHFDRHLNPEVKSLRYGELSVVEEASIIDTYSVKISLKQPFAPFLAALFDWSGFIVSPTAVERWGDDYGFHPVGTGPFRFVEYVKDQYTVVERNPDYWEKELPLLDQITFRPIPVDSTRLAELRAGGVHVAEDIPLQDVRRLQESTALVLSIREGFRFDYMHFVSDKEPYGTNKKVRQAVNWAIDREAILNGAFFGIGAVGYQPFFPGTPFYDPNFRPYTRDLEKAKRLLDESGAPMPIRWQVAMTQDPVKQRVSQLVQVQLAEVGIEIELQQMDTAAYRERVLSRADTFYIGFGWWGWRPDPDQYLSTLLFSGSNNNYGNIKDPRIDELLAKGRATADLQERIRIYRQLRDIVSEESVYIYYWEGPNIKGLSPKVHGFRHMPDSIIRYHHLSLEG